MKYLLLLLLLSSCAASHNQEDRWPASKGSVPIPPASEPRKEPVTSEKPPAKSGLLSGIGKVFSTPEGTARRQAVKLAKAAVPRSIGKGAVYAPNADKVANSYKGEGNSTAADSGAAVNNNAANSQQQVANGDNNQMDAQKQDTIQEAQDWKAALASPTGKVVAGIAGLVLLGGLAYGVSLLIPVLRARKAAKTIA